MARLIYVPVVHSLAEMGSQAPAYKAVFVARYGQRQWIERAERFDRIWSAIGRELEARVPVVAGVKLYQDSLPICADEAALVHDFAAQGSRNHQLLEASRRKGATLVGTESPALLLEEYRVLQSASRSKAEETKLLDLRDRFIATRIDETLGASETGVLFLGALHRAANYLPARIAVEYLTICGC
jgi:hypothetical protein